MKSNAMRSLLLLIAAIICMSSSCEKKDDKGKCDEVPCTQIFMMTMVDVKDNSGAKVVLDDHYTLRVSNGEKIRATDQGNPDGGYVVLDDNYQSKLANKKEEFRFIGIKNGVEVVNEVYVFSADCCHIEKVSGKTEIVIP
jgi:hypothetical protein